MNIIKDVHLLTPEDFQNWPVWMYLNDDKIGEMKVVPVDSAPIRSLDHCITGARVKLACGKEVWARFSNISADDSFRTKHLMSVTLLTEKGSFHLARYHDPFWRLYGPEQLARFLDMTLDQVFPIKYDLRPCCKHDAEGLFGLIERSPKNKLSRQEVIGLISGGGPNQPFG